MSDEIHEAESLLIEDRIDRWFREPARMNTESHVDLLRSRHPIHKEETSIMGMAEGVPKALSTSITFELTPEDDPVINCFFCKNTYPVDLSFTYRVFGQRITTGAHSGCVAEAKKNQEGTKR